MSIRATHFTMLTVAALGAVLAASAPIAGQDKEDPILAFTKPRLKDAAKPFTLVVMVQVKDDAAEKFEAAFAKALTATRKEKGCLSYDLNRDSQDAKRYVVYERWKSLADLETHLKSDHIKALREVLPDVITGAPELRILIPAGE